MNAGQILVVWVAMSAAVGMGVYPNVDAIDELIKIHHVVEPRSGIKNRYEDLYGEYRALYEALAPVYRRLSQIQ